MLQVMDRRLAAKLVKQDQYDQITSRIREELIEKITGEDDQSCDANPDPVTDTPLNRTPEEEEGPEIIPIRSSVDPVKFQQENGLIRCNCGNVYVAGTQCMKCKKTGERECVK
jgi:hypothetical protein